LSGEYLEFQGFETSGLDEAATGVKVNVGSDGSPPSERDGEAMKELRDGLRMPYRDFWVAYLDAHRNPATRGMHYLATLTGIVGTVLAIWMEFLWLMAGGIGSVS
jgi:hypothetical protein